jgi:hypothetical protein
VPPADAIEGQSDVPSSNDAAPLGDLPVQPDIEDVMSRADETLPAADVGELAAAFDGLEVAETADATDLELLGESPVLEPTAGADVTLADVAAPNIAIDAGVAAPPAPANAPDVSTGWLAPSEVTGAEPNAPVSVSLPTDGLPSRASQPTPAIDDLLHRLGTPLKIARGPYDPNSGAPLKIALLSGQLSDGDSSSDSASGPGPQSPPADDKADGGDAPPSMTRPIVMVTLADSKSIVAEVLEQFAERSDARSQQIAQWEINYAISMRDQQIQACMRR